MSKESLKKMLKLGKYHTLTNSEICKVRGGHVSISTGSANWSSGAEQK